MPDFHCVCFPVILIFLFFFHLCGMRDSSPQPGIEPMPRALAVQSLNHRTTREVPIILICKLCKHVTY